ncbi:MAG: hypothetical protein JSV13_06615 [Nitrospiraceae bacterium]|nr:MAG: hypothetical protein JSV13_06615 [Nitrospiraceae bacterium]
MKITIRIALIFLLLSVLAFADITRFDVPLGDSPQLGPPNALITMIEFLDFQ